MKKIRILGGKRITVRVPDRLISTEGFVGQIKPVLQKIANRLTEDDWRGIG